MLNRIFILRLLSLLSTISLLAGNNESIFATELIRTQRSAKLHNIGNNFILPSLGYNSNRNKFINSRVDKDLNLFKVYENNRIDKSQVKRSNLDVYIYDSLCFLNKKILKEINRSGLNRPVYLDEFTFLRSNPRAFVSENNVLIRTNSNFNKFIKNLEENATILVLDNGKIVPAAELDKVSLNTLTHSRNKAFKISAFSYSDLMRSNQNRKTQNESACFVLSQNPDPTRNRFLTPELNPPKPLKKEVTEPILTTPKSSINQKLPTQTNQRVFIRKIQVTGSTIFENKDFEMIVRPFRGQEIGRDQIQAIASEITQLYLNKGYITTRAQPVGQDIVDDVLEIRIIEGSLRDIEIEGNRHLNSSYILQRVKLGVGQPLNVNKLEEQLRLLRANPLLKTVEAGLRPTGLPGQSDLVVSVKEANRFSANIGIDNYSPPSIGSERFGGLIGFRNLSGIGDEISASFYRTTTGGSTVLDFVYSIPVNPMNGQIRLRATPTWTRVTEAPFDELGIGGNRQLYELVLRQPIVRSPRQEFAVSTGFTYQTGQTFLFDRIPTPFGVGPDENGISRTSVFQIGQDFTHRDSTGAWSVRSQLNFGVDILDATVNPAPIPDGRFFSWLGKFQRAQQLGQNHLLLLQADLQLTPHTLLPAQQFVIGGAQSVRGYRQNARSGDNGLRFSIEDRITVKRNRSGDPTMQLVPFIEVGTIWNTPSNPNPTARQTTLFGAGLSFLWDDVLSIKNLSLRLDYGFPFIDLDDRGNNIQDSSLYFRLNYRP